MLVNEARKYMGMKGGTVDHAAMVDYYNLHSGKPRGYTLQYDDNWCMAFVSVCAMKAGFTPQTFPIECGCERAYRKALDIDGAETVNVDKLQRNDIVMFGSTSWANHVGIVSYVTPSVVYVIEGNNLNRVQEVKHSRDDFVHALRIKIAGMGTPAKTNDEIAREVRSGMWGNNPKRKEALESAGYDYYAIQSIVNSLCNADRPPYDLEEIANEVAMGKWGNNPERRRRLEEAGFDYNEVQKIVNQMKGVKK